MKPETFRAWQDHMGLSGVEIAKALGKSDETISVYRKKGVPKRESLLIRLALRALANALPPWPE